MVDFYRFSNQKRSGKILEGKDSENKEYLDIIRKLEEAASNEGRPMVMCQKIKRSLSLSLSVSGWSGGAMVLGKLPFQGVLLIWIIV